MDSQFQTETEGGPDGLERRHFLATSLLLAAGGLAAGGLLAGCNAHSGSGIPNPVWPDMEGNAVGGRTTWYPVAPSTAKPGVPQPLPVAPSGVIPRSSWTRAALIPSRADRMGSIYRITVHHDAIVSSNVNSQSDAARRLESVRQSHVKQGWADIGYHYVIDPQGRVWEGRSIGWQGAHVQDNNPGNVGIMVMGNFDQQRPSSQALNTLDGFVAQQMKRYGVPVSRVYTHQEIRPTACPGRNLQRYMQETRARSGRLTRYV
jgi:hypothetical protein